MNANPDRVLSTSERLAQLSADAPDEGVTLDWVLSQLHERAFGLFLLILALPCCIPFLYGVPQIVSLPLMFIAAQLVMGRKAPWLPARLGRRQISRESLASLSMRASPWLQRIEAVSHPRLVWLTHRPADRIIGAALVIFCGSILLPIPLTNTVPAVGVVLISMGFLQRDGLLVLLGTITGTAWIASLVFAGATLITVLRDLVGL